MKIPCNLFIYNDVNNKNLFESIKIINCQGINSIDSRTFAKTKRNTCIQCNEHETWFFIFVLIYFERHFEIVKCELWIASSPTQLWVYERFVETLFFLFILLLYRLVFIQFLWKGALRYYRNEPNRFSAIPLDSRIAIANGNFGRGERSGKERRNTNI